MSNARRLVVFALVSGSVGWNTFGVAQDGVAPASAAQAAREEPASVPPAIDPDEAIVLTHRAVQKLRQAALQRDVADWAQERVLLERARANLDRALPGLTGAQRERASQLRADLDAALRRPSKQLGRFDSPFDEAYDPPLPGRNELALLAKQGQAFLHDQTLSLPPNTDDVAWAGHGVTSMHKPMDGLTGPQGARGVTSSVPGETVAWPQLNFRLGR